MGTLVAQSEFQLTPSEPSKLTAMDLLQVALSKDAAIDVIERLMILQREERDYQARVSFDEALSRCQERIAHVAPNKTNSQTSSEYADYDQLDRSVRPIYTAEGFSVSFTERDCPTPGKTRFVALLSRSGVVREYQKDLTPSTKGPKGNDVMTPIHADGSADSYAKRYLVKNIFNIAIGKEDNDGNGLETNGELAEQLEWIANAKDYAELDRLFRQAFKMFASNSDAQKAVITAKDKRRREIH